MRAASEPTGLGGAVRAHVADSWVRSAAAGVRADTVDAPITLPADALGDHRAAHPLASVFPLLDDVLGQAARECDAIMAVSDAAGQLLWVAAHDRCGARGVRAGSARRRSRRLRLIPLGLRTFDAQ